jgi:lysophospholipid acyltransferase (LPLAT)-like uncharacterized protein
MGKLKSFFRSIKKFPGWIYWLPAKIHWLYFNLCFRKKIVDPNGFYHAFSDVIVVTWHNRLFFFPAAFPKEGRKRTVAVISASRDGQYIADFAAQFGVQSVRGSSSRGGAAAQLGAVQACREKKNVVFTPDGPRGPKYVIKRGPIQLASKMGKKIVPVLINASSCWQLKRWDGFQIPKPLSTLTIAIGDPVEVPPDLDAEGIETYRKHVEEAMLAITCDPE